LAPRDNFPSDWKRRLTSQRVISRVLFGAPRPVPAAEIVNELTEEVLSGSQDLLVSVGSGVISDLVKKISLNTEAPNWCVATAASVDTFSSATAAIHVRGFHNSVPAAVSQTIICDLAVIEKAPDIMILAGLGDLLAKFIAYLDWNLSRIMTGEHYCEVISSAAIESAQLALSAARHIGDNPRGVARAMTDAALVSGFAMQAIGGSRPASSVELRWHISGRLRILSPWNGSTSIAFLSEWQAGWFFAATRSCTGR
jgi:glycerol-1-phosphate dehydrogenase [NAD(P)+]